MLDDEILALAHAAGLAIHWKDADGLAHSVSQDTLRAVLQALGYAAETDAERAQAWAKLTEEAARNPDFLSADAGQPVPLPDRLAAEAFAEVTSEDGREGRVAIHDGQLPAFTAIGYHRVDIAGHVFTLAIAPPRCCELADPAIWGPAIQIPSLRSDGMYGTFEDLRVAGLGFAEEGADLLAISPVHALVPGSARHFSPYAPSSRTYLNTLLADAPVSPPDHADDDLIDWTAARDAALLKQRATFAALDEETQRAVWDEAQSDPALIRHALFDALSIEFRGRPWQRWPAAFQNPQSPAVDHFARSHWQEVAVHILAQTQTDRMLGKVQASARQAGMRIGLIADLAVGVDPGGSDVWSDPDGFLRGLTIGAPPDPLGPEGQNWGLTTYSPHALRARGFRPWIRMIRAALRHAGGLRIDHAFGLRRLWVIPEGAPSTEGVYLDYPFEDLLRILAIESHRSHALIIAEDLGTAPESFMEVIAARGILGMSVLWFERDAHGKFAAASAYRPHSVAMTGTHDTPTVAGWWRARDLEWRQSLQPETPADHDRRAEEREHLWNLLAGAPEALASVSTDSVVDAALAHIAQAPTPVKIISIEDLLGLEEQPNLPGTLDEHPNWRRRLPAPVDALLRRPEVARRTKMLRDLCGRKADTSVDAPMST
ncbi:4-alpha-glucanotransferase [Sphingobium sp. B12D2B]|uniref:4-alpha-glucanotransferase n=1 Tax=Sphingobium sp. B12D2B TaxID=2940577 RepID=UPI0022240FD0|nr:4-alpha-glucanotransferase [Sphingobium sp. B12D2B]MCW2351630.1 4-alpha-glucanotransferase [Sphingobium sp. B12D2B]